MDPRQLFRIGCSPETARGAAIFLKTEDPIEFERISPQSFFKFIRERHSEVFIKADGTRRGLGIAKPTTNEVNEDAFRRTGNCVVQAPVRQHAFFDRFVSGPVATIRIVTVKEPDGKVGARASYLKLGRKDAAWIAAGQSVKVAVVGDDGDLDTLGYTKDWRCWPHHPDTRTSFQNRRIPMFKEAVERCVQLHASVPHLHVIGWDVAIDDDRRVRLLESNGYHCGIRFPEAAMGPCFIGLNWERLGRDRGNRTTTN